jgi:tRNA(fMet)-specific endonuclease VapC
MEPRYLLDTNTFIYLRRRRPEQVVKRFKALIPGEAVLSIITYGELLYGAEKSTDRIVSLERIHNLTNLMPVLTLPDRAAEIYGAIRAELESKGQPIGNSDLWIAAHAVASNLTLITNNEREFRRVHGLAIQNWVN